MGVVFVRGEAVVIRGGVTVVIVDSGRNFIWHALRDEAFLRCGQPKKIAGCEMR